MEPNQLLVLGYIAIGLQCLIVGLLIWRKRFGCYSSADREAIAKDVVRFMYEDRQAEMYRTLDQLLRGRRDVVPTDYEEDCA